AAHCLVAWLGVIIVFVLANLGDGFILHHMKSYFEYPRPYVALGPESVTLIDFHHDAAEDSHSFPSGHAAFITVLVVSLWPVLSVGLRGLGVGLIAGVCWSRTAEGMHFPADVLGGFLVSLIVTLIVRSIINKPLVTLQMKC